MGLIFGLIFAGSLAALYVGFFSIRFVLSLDTFHRWHKSTLQKIQNGIGIFGLGWFIFISLLWPRHSSLRHKVILCFVCAYTFLFFNPQVALSTSKANNTTYCPDGMAYKVDNSHYIRCEDFDEFHADQYHGRLRADLYINGGK